MLSEKETAQRGFEINVETLGSVASQVTGRIRTANYCRAMRCKNKFSSQFFGFC